MKKFIMLASIVVTSVSTLVAQDHGSITYSGKKISLTGYRTRMNNEKRIVIADGKLDGKLYSVTVTFKPDITSEATVKTDATHSVTLSVSNADYSDARNVCFDGGSSISVVPKDGRFVIKGSELISGNCFGKSQGTDKISIEMKP